MKCKKCGYNRTVEELNVIRLEKALENSIPKDVLQKKFIKKLKEELGKRGNWFAKMGISDIIDIIDKLVEELLSLPDVLPDALPDDKQVRQVKQGEEKKA